MNFRVIVYDDMGCPHLIWHKSTGVFGFKECEKALIEAVESKSAIGGRIEKYVNGQGWVVAEEEE